MAITANTTKRGMTREEQEKLIGALTQKGASAQTAAAAQAPATTGASTGASTGATAGATGNAYQQYLAAQDRLAQRGADRERTRIMTSGTPQERAALSQQETRQNALQHAANTGSLGAVAQLQTQAAMQRLENPYQAAVRGSAIVTPEQLNDYTWYSWMGDNEMHTMNDRERRQWQEAMNGYANGDYRAFNDNFQTAGNWGSYIDEKGNVNGMLRYIGDGVGGYVPVSNGRVMQGMNPNNDYAFYGPNGEVYTVDGSGNLTRAGNWTMQNGPAEGAPPHAMDKNTLAWWNSPERQENLREAELYGHGNAAMPGANPILGNDGGNSTPVGGSPGRSSGYSSGGSSSSVPTPSAGSYQPTQQDTVSAQAQAQAQANPNIYQTYLDQWEYDPAPEWEGTDYERQRDEALAQAGEKWQGSEYQPLRDAALKRAEEMQWNYDPNSDPVWQAYQKQYRREGDRASQEAMAQAAMRTGGLANSYAATAASQAGDYYASQLSDKLPQLYQDAYNRYLQEFQRQMGISDQYQGFDDREYSRWADQQGRNFDLADRYNQYGNTEYQRYMDRLGQYNTDRNFDYGRYRDAVGDARYADETQYNRNYQAQRDAISDQRYDQEWAQQLREYADAQGWKQAEWNQYLREYGDKLSEQEKEWVYQQSRDAVSDQQYADKMAYQRELDAYDQAWNENDRDYTRNWNESKYNDSMKMEALDYLNKNQIVTGIYADILGVPEGTTYEQYYSQFLGGSTSPFDETEIPSGKTPQYTPKYTPPDDTPPDDVQNEPVYQELRSKYGEDTAMEVWNLTQQPWFSELKRVAYSNKNDALDYLYYLVETGKVSNNEKVVQILADMLGLTEESVSYAPEYGTQTGGKKEPFAMIDLKP